MEIAVNRCFGGFDLSNKAQERLIELGVPFYKSWEELKNADKKDKEIYIVKMDKPMLGAEYANNFDYSENRTNKLLIQVVKELGKEASGTFGEIEIVDIPDGVDWEIDNYDGMETVEEAHMRW